MPARASAQTDTIDQFLYDLLNTDEQEAADKAFAADVIERFEATYQRIRAAADRCDIPTMRANLAAMESDLQRLRDFLREYPDPQLAEALVNLETYVNLARREQPRNCTKSTGEPPTEQLTTGTDPGTEAPPPAKTELQTPEEVLNDAYKITGTGHEEALQRARDAAARCDRASLDKAIRDLEELRGIVQSIINGEFSNVTTSASTGNLAMIDVLSALRLAESFVLKNCTKTGASPEAEEQLTTGPSSQPLTNESGYIPFLPLQPTDKNGDGKICPDEKAAHIAFVQAQLDIAVQNLGIATAKSQSMIDAGVPPASAQFPITDWTQAVAGWRDALRQAQGMFVDDCGEKPEEELLTVGDLGLKLVQDSGTWCEFGPDDPRDLPVPEDGDDPRDADDPDGDDPRDADTPDGDDPRDVPIPDGDDPRDADTPDDDDPRDVPIPIPDGDDPRDADDADDPRDKDDEEDDPRDVPLVVKATSAAQAGGVQQAVSGQQVKLFAPSQQPENLALPSPGGVKPQTDASEDPLSCVTGADGSCTIPVNAAELGLPADAKLASSYEVDVSAAASKSYNILTTLGAPLGALESFVISGLATGDGREWVTVMAGSPAGIARLESLVSGLVGQVGILGVEENLCRTKEHDTPDDPHYRGKGAWGQRHDDQWAIKRVGLTGDDDSAWEKLGPDAKPVIVAVIDSGLDWNHLDFNWNNLWKNSREIEGNRIDDDGNGYVDDIIGWDFLGNNNKPWDHDGHGTITAGIIAADSGNGVGMAGINPHARIMVLKALNAFGHSRASYIANAIVYAADNGARVINLSVGGPGLTGIEKDAIAYAKAKGVVIIVAAGNAGINVETYGPASDPGVITVAATGLKDEHPNFSNWGPGIDIAAPGVDVLGLRARRTDTVLGIPDVPYTAGEGYVGADKRYYRVSGTSFAAPIVAGVASLILSNRPELTGAQVEAILVQSAADIQTPGRDNFSGAGMVDARAALDFDPSVSVEAAIGGIEVVQTAAGPAVRVNGTIAADRLGSARIEIGAGSDPASFRAVATGLGAGTGALAEIPAENFRTAREWTIRLVVVHANGTTREARFLLDVGG